MFVAFAAVIVAVLSIISLSAEQQPPQKGASGQTVHRWYVDGVSETGFRRTRWGAMRLARRIIRRHHRNGSPWSVSVTRWDDDRNRHRR